MGFKTANWRKFFAFFFFFAFVRSPLPWQNSSCRMVWSSESVLRVRSNSGPTFGSRAPFTHCSWDDVTRLIRASEIYKHNRPVEVCRYTHVAMDRTHTQAGERNVQSKTNRKWEMFMFKYCMLATLWYPPWIENSLSVLGSIQLAWLIVLYCIVSDGWNEAGLSAVPVLKHRFRPLLFLQELHCLRKKKTRMTYVH